MCVHVPQLGAAKAPNDGTEACVLCVLSVCRVFLVRWSEGPVGVCLCTLLPKEVLSQLQLPSAVQL